MPETWFTPASARRALRDVRPAAEHLRRLFHAMERCRPVRMTGDQPVAPHYFRLLRAFHDQAYRLARRGVRVRDPREGVVEFPARRRGRPVMLRWSVGEATLNTWHEPGAACRTVDDDGPWDEPGTGPGGPS